MSLRQNINVNRTLTAGGPVCTGRLMTLTDATATRVCTSADYGKVIFLSYGGAVAVTLPANGAPAGSWIMFVIIGTDSCAPTIASATIDTLIAFNDQTADSLTFGSGHRIGGCLLFISTGTYWVGINLSGSNTVTVNT